MTYNLNGIFPGYEEEGSLLPTNVYKSSSLMLQPSEEGSSHWLSINDKGYKPMASCGH